MMKNCVKSIILSLVLMLSLSTNADVQSFKFAGELKNRFRIDHMVSHITLFVQREYGSPPVIVVLPDGTKWYSSRHPEDVKWVDGMTGDIIYIPNPVPGPWQLLGRVVEGSNINKVSSLNIELAPFPQPIFQGEKLKVTAHFNSDGNIMRLPGLDYLVDWTARLKRVDTSTTPTSRSTVRHIGTYKDDGKLLDEYPDDGVFTSNFNLDVDAGEYIFSVKAKNEVFERTVSTPIHLTENPIKINLVPPFDIKTGNYRLEIFTDPERVKLEDTHIEYELFGPNGFKDKIYLNDIFISEMDISLPKVNSFGNYLLKGQAVTTTAEGREIILSLPETSFHLKEPEIKGPTEAELAIQAAKKAILDEELAQKKIVAWTISINLFLLIASLGGFIYWRKRQVMIKAMKVAQQNIIDEAVREDETDHTLQAEDIDLTMPDDESSDKPNRA
ncbi:TIGR03503 family protein [Parashewanella spongiae]|uniref:TIGR03503 family protein n=1 Tax=Parashewanella spongiae TaxID=342950 RepID=A0A3A6TPK0_9GAMM|nr:TIGR03503 family protein [Parashewanella spongiae]MCL1078671.1 TIGR03503 family protein [Parashewanella spongiae]RJY12956.1 TIGR03503 family protein [Parashewanella spongiae]